QQLLREISARECARCSEYCQKIDEYKAQLQEKELVISELKQEIASINASENIRVPKKRLYSDASFNETDGDCSPEGKILVPETEFADLHNGLTLNGNKERTVIPETEFPNTSRVLVPETQATRKRLSSDVQMFIPETEMDCLTQKTQDDTRNSHKQP